MSDYKEYDNTEIKSERNNKKGQSSESSRVFPKGCVHSVNRTTE